MYVWAGFTCGQAFQFDLRRTPGFAGNLTGFETVDRWATNRYVENRKGTDMTLHWQKRWQQKRGDFAVPCIVSGRWLEFCQDGSVNLNEGAAIRLAVITEGQDDKPRKLCELIVTRGELLRVLRWIEKPAS